MDLPGSPSSPRSGAARPSASPPAASPNAAQVGDWVPDALDRSLWRAVAGVALSVLALLLLASALARFAGLSGASEGDTLGIARSTEPAALTWALLWFAGGVWIVRRGLRTGAHPHDRFGAANAVTLFRLALAGGLVVLIGQDAWAAPWNAPGNQALGWTAVVLATVTAVLDACDGPLARRSGLASAFGARFDMETDAALIVVLCVGVWLAGQAGPWVLAAGLMRYAFVAAARVWPWLAAPLAPSRRRQTVCVVQITTLIVCLGPIISPAVATPLAAASIALLGLSFAIDIRTLARQRPRTSEP